MKLISGEIAGIMFSWDMRKSQIRSLGSFILGFGTGFCVGRVCPRLISLHRLAQTPLRLWFGPRSSMDVN